MFTHRLGPLPMWLWVVIIGAVIVGWSLYKSRTSGGGSQQQDTTGTDTPASDVPQFVNQTYTTVQAPNVQDNDDTGPVRVGPRPGGTVRVGGYYRGPAYGHGYNWGYWGGYRGGWWRPAPYPVWYGRPYPYRNPFPVVRPYPYLPPFPGGYFSWGF